METLTAPRAMVAHARYSQDRDAVLAALDPGSIDAPIVDVVRAFAALSHCFTLQCCHGHFVCTPEQDHRTPDAVPPQHSGTVRYRIAYLAVCVQDSRSGRALLDSLREVPAIDPGYVQLGSADWFWERWPNSYALQVQPSRYATRDEAVLEPAEALHVQHTRDLFFDEVRELLERELALTRGARLQ